MVGFYCLRLCILFDERLLLRRVASANVLCKRPRAWTVACLEQVFCAVLGCGDDKIDHDPSSAIAGGGLVWW